MLSTGKLTSFDLDHESEKSAAGIKNSNFNFIRANFSEVSSFFQNSSLDGAIIDCGVSSPQIDQPERGFSFQKDGPLDMRFGDLTSKTCYDIVNFYSEKNLAKIFKQFGEEKQSKKIAKAICVQREKKKFETTMQLAIFIKGIKTIKEKKNPATKVFQALRMEVNSEIDNLHKCLISLKKLMKKGGKIIVISFHSIEDRLVKNLFKHKEKIHEKSIPIKNDSSPEFKVSKLIVPSDQEVEMNVRSRSARMRIITKL